ncbi:hypothetical protein LWE61_11205 [Sphingobium sufflavum]|uniref:hypothetical protein n=1 Tax=Sphingobium sufflavum TaxID=1129547 RepID=UPI001F44A9BB|nr:hypothetical protein [Sphingobium sufflavum]MCE7797125.1 hypothetical protein [Sphingobium sufflavum]
MTILLMLAAIAFSTALLVLLCRGDPKRRRTLRQSGKGHGPALRRLLVALSLLPGVGYAVAGDAAAVLIWFGGYAVVGWFVTLSAAQWQDG